LKIKFKSFLTEKKWLIFKKEGFVAAGEVVGWPALMLRVVDWVANTVVEII
jgi:hypothetical protein